MDNKKEKKHSINDFLIKYDRLLFAYGAIIALLFIDIKGTNRATEIVQDVFKVAVAGISIALYLEINKAYKLLKNKE